MRSYFQNSSSCFIGVSKRLETIKALGLRPRAFICFSVFGYPDETLALVLEIVHNKEKRNTAAMNRLLTNRTAHTSQAMLPESLFLMFQKLNIKNMRVLQLSLSKYKTYLGFRNTKTLSLKMCLLFIVV